MTQPCHLSAVEARRLIGTKKLSPVELMQSCLDQISRVNPAVNAVVAIDEAIAVIVDSVASDFPRVAPHLRGQIVVRVTDT